MPSAGVMNEFLLVRHYTQTGLLNASATMMSNPAGVYAQTVWRTRRHPKCPQVLHDVRDLVLGLERPLVHGVVEVVPNDALNRPLAGRISPLEDHKHTHSRFHNRPRHCYDLGLQALQFPVVQLL
jgi:hypothetical protein